MLALPLVGLGIVILFPLITRATLKQGIVFNVAYEVIRVTASWLSDLFTNFWYGQMASIPKFEGEKQMSTAGAFVIYGTGFALVGGMVTMAINIAGAEPLLQQLERDGHRILPPGTQTCCPISRIPVFILPLQSLCLGHGAGIVEPPQSRSDHDVKVLLILAHL